jgi:hypothetical protein
MSQFVLDEYNKERGVRSNFEGAGVSYDDAAQMESYNQNIQVLQSQTNMSENEILEISRMNNFINQGAGGSW